MSNRYVFIFCFAVQTIGSIHAMHQAISTKSHQKTVASTTTRFSNPFKTIPEFSFDYKKPERLVYSIRKILYDNKIVAIEDERVVQLARALAKTGIRFINGYATATLPMHVAVAEGDGLVSLVLLEAIFARHGVQKFRTILTQPNAQGLTLKQLINSAQDNGWGDDIKKILELYSL